MIYYCLLSRVNSSSTLHIQSPEPGSVLFLCFCFSFGLCRQPEERRLSAWSDLAASRVGLKAESLGTPRCCLPPFSPLDGLRERATPKALSHAKCRLTQAPLASFPHGTSLYRCHFYELVRRVLINLTTTECACTAPCPCHSHSIFTYAYLREIL